MSLEELRVQNVRCIESAELTLHSGCNLIWGGNGAGKTSLLEALFLLGRGRSFRTRHSEHLIRRQAEQLIVFGRSEGGRHYAGIEFDRRRGAQARINGAAVSSLAELTLTFPVQVIDPDIHKLVEEGGRRRRRWLDWAVFHVEPRFGEWWARYTRALRQRNAALKGRTDPRPWEAEIADLGERISEARRVVIETLQPHWREVIARVHCPEGELHFARGWSTQLSLRESLEASRARDALRQLTHPGPHRADVLIQVAGRSAREVLSRGQQKLMAAALTLAQLQLLRDVTGTLPALLLDDPAAELDPDHLAGFVEEISRLRCQLVVTSLQPQIPGFRIPDRVFHVEHGTVSPV